MSVTKSEFEIDGRSFMDYLSENNPTITEDIKWMNTEIGKFGSTMGEIPREVLIGSVGGILQVGTLLYQYKVNLVNLLREKSYNVSLESDIAELMNIIMGNLAENPNKE